MSLKRHLKPGEMFFGEGQLLETLLGSCVAITVWYPQARKGGICHFLLADRQRHLTSYSRNLDGRYGREAWLWLRQQSLAHGLAMADAQVKLFGGSKVLQLLPPHLIADIGYRNIELAKSCLREAGLQVFASDVGGSGHRLLRFDLNTGDAWVRRGNGLNGVPFQEAC